MCMNEMVNWCKIGGETKRIKFVEINKKWWQFWKIHKIKKNNDTI